MMALLEAQQQYFSYRSILVVIVSLDSFVLFFNGVSHSYRAIRCKMGYRGCACVKLSTTGGYRTILGGANLPEKILAIWGIAATPFVTK